MNLGDWVQWCRRRTGWGGTRYTFCSESKEVLLSLFRDSSDFLEMGLLSSLAFHRMGRVAFSFFLLEKGILGDL